MAGLIRRLGGLSEGRGRRAALVVLGLFVILEIAAPALMNAPRQALFDAYQRTMPRRRDPALAPVVIVRIDNATLQAEGEWPWPHDRLADLVSAIQAQKPAVLGMDMVLPRPRRGARGSAAMASEEADRVLAAAMAAGPVVIGVTGDSSRACGPGQGAAPGDAASGLFPPLLFKGPGAALEALPCYPTAHRSVDVIDLAAAGHGVISNAGDPDGVFRRLQAMTVVEGQAAPGFALEVYRVANRAPFLTLVSRRAGLRSVRVGDFSIPVDRDGGLRINYAAPSAFNGCSAEDLLQNNACIDPTTRRPIDLAGRVVLLGLDADGVGDQQRNTPVGPMPGVDVHAQAVDNLFAGRFAARPWRAARFEPVLTAVLGLFLIIVLPLARANWRIAAAVAPLILLAVAGDVLWWNFRWLVDVATPAIGCLAVILALVGGGLAEVDAQRRRLRRELEIGRLNAARAEGELEAGRRIQVGILPTPASLAPDPRFDLDAVMTPARQIGGDLYDFFKIDEDRLFLLVGDVSGKGLPASLFMALGKSLCKSCALRGETDIGAIVRRANAEISRDNPEMLFITLFAGILDLETGELAFCNAGHDAPFLLRPGEPPAPASTSAGGGPPLCVVEDFPYATETRRLRPGDMLCLTTDGVTEAMTQAGALLGRDEVEKILAAMSPDLSAHAVTEALQSAVAAFVAGAEPSDDLTILTIRWNGPRARAAAAA